MQVKTYRGSTEREAISLAKQDLGEDILIVEMKRHMLEGQDPSVAQYLVTVALESIVPNQVEAIEPKYSPPIIKSPQRVRMEQSIPASADIAEALPKDATLNEQDLAELFMLRKQLRSLKAGIRASEMSPFEAPFDMCFDLMVEAGTPEHIAEKLVIATAERLDELGINTRVAAMEELKRQISYHFVHNAPVPTVGKQEVIVFLGPSGAGKTSLIAKLAAHKDAYRGRKLAIISTDNYRAGANEGLKSIGTILETPIIEVRQMEDIPRALTNLVDYDVILVDTPGRSPLVKNALPELQTRLALLNPTETVVVLSATMGIEELWLFNGLYKSLAPTSLAITKLDETSKPGKVLGAADDPQLPLRYVTDGRAVPKSLILNPGAAVLRRLPLTVG